MKGSCQKKNIMKEYFYYSSSSFQLIHSFLFNNNCTTAHTHENQLMALKRTQSETYKLLMRATIIFIIFN